MQPIFFVYTVIFIAFVFDFVNGFHDAGNSVATIVTTKVLKPAWAVLWVAFFNFVAFVFFHLNVANTLGTGLVDPHMVSPGVVLAALVGAISFNLITARLGLPSSSSHALMGGLVGAVVTSHGWTSIQWQGLTKVLLAIIFSPLLGILFSYIILTLIHQCFQTIQPLWAKRCQLLSAALLSLGHGGNDAQKTMGIIALLLFSTGQLGHHFYVPFWVVLGCNLVMGLGTLVGGWRIVRTLGKKLTRLEPVSGAAAETTSAIILFIATALGIPISTSHTVTGAILGVGLYNDRGIAWRVMRKIFLAWCVTIPCAALVAAAVIELGG